MMKYKFSGPSWRITALAALALIGFAAHGPEAHAGPIIVTGVYIPHGDPAFEYMFNVQLNQGYDLTAGESFTIQGLPGLTTNSPSYVSSPYTFPYPKITQESSPSSNLYDVTWTYSGDQGTLAGPLNLGSFSIYTMNYPSGTVSPFPSGETTASLTYTTTIGGTSGTGSFTISSVPEPSSMVLLLIGGAIPAGVSVWRRWRRAG